MSEITERLAELEQLGLTRRLRMVSGPQGPTVLLDGKPVLLLCSNNYLGLADHPRVRQAAADVIDVERAAVAADATRIASQVIRDAGEEARRLVREAMLLAIALAVVVLGLPFVAGYVVGRARRGP